MFTAKLCKGLKTTSLVRGILQRVRLKNQILALVQEIYKNN